MYDPQSMPIPSEEAALARAKISRFVAALFCEPDEALVAHLADRGLHDELAAAAQELKLSQNLITKVFQAAAQRFDAALYADLLGHTVRSACPPYEMEYRGSEVFQQSQHLADIAGFYSAFGFAVDGSMPERADHIVTEWEFLAALAVKQAMALRDDNMPAADCCRDAQRSFLADHAAYWMPSFFERIRKADSESVLARVADLAEAALRDWCSALSVTVGPQWLELRSVSDEDSSITCGAADAGGQVELGPTLAAGIAGRS